MFGGAVAITLVWPCVSLYRGTAPYDWYAAAKLTVVEATIAVGFNPDGATPYRVPEGTVYQVGRGWLTEYSVPIEARERIFYTAVVGTFHGGCAGVLWFVLWVIFWRVVGDPQNRGAGWRWPWGPRDRGPQEIVETWDPSGIEEPLPANAAGDARIALWVLSARQAARLMELLGAVKNRRAIPAQPPPERATTPLLPAADATGAAAESAGKKAKSAGANPKDIDGIEKKRQKKAGGSGKPRASSDASDPDSEDGLAGPEEGGDVNWI